MDRLTQHALPIPIPEHYYYTQHDHNTAFPLDILLGSLSRIPRRSASKIAACNTEDKRRCKARGMHARVHAHVIYIRSHACTTELAILPFSTEREWGRGIQSKPAAAVCNRQYGFRKLKASCFAYETRDSVIASLRKLDFNSAVCPLATESAWTAEMEGRTE